MTHDTFKIAAIQASPIFMDREATVDKVCNLIAEVAAKGVRLAVFPETFIPGYPDWIWFVPPGQIALNQQLYGELVDQSVTIPSPTLDKISQAARKAGIYVSIGINERNIEASGGTLFNTNLLIDKDGALIARHQKLVPTVSERTVWAYGDPSTLDVYDTEIGKISGLICHENYMPLVRYSLYGRGIEIYVAPTYDEGDTWQSTIRHIGREGRVYAIGCCMVLRKEDVLSRFPQLEPYYAEAGEWINTGNSIIGSSLGNNSTGDGEGRFLSSNHLLNVLKDIKGINYGDVKTFNAKPGRNLCEKGRSKWLVRRVLCTSQRGYPQCILGRFKTQSIIDRIFRGAQAEIRLNI
jgi:nitrilase